MPTTMTSREFNQHRSRVKRAVAEGPVMVTDRGELSIVVLSADEYRRLTRTEKSVAESLSSPETAHLDVEFPRFKDLPRDVDLG